MASRIMHLAITDRLAEKFNIADTYRLKLGAILPDAYSQAGEKATAASHLKIPVCGYSKKTFDLSRYRKLFGSKIRSDMLYLGYYLHLIQDIVFRHFIYDIHKWNSAIPENVQKLHNDYAIINTYLIEKYHLKNDIVIPADFAKEEIFTLYPYDVNRMITDLQRDFDNIADGEIFFFTREMADEYIRTAVEICGKVLEDTDNSVADEYLWAWKDTSRSFLETTMNTRELGGYRIAGSNTYTPYNTVLRSDVQKHPNEADIQKLRERNISVIIDMRSEWEVAKEPSGFADIAGFEYHNFPIEEGSRVAESIEAIPHMLMAISKSDNIPKVFREIARAETGVIFNCSAGKDRSGVVSAILLMTCGVCDEDIVYNYMLTKEHNKSRFELIHRESPQLNMNLVIPNETNMKKFLALFRKEFNNTENYFETIGLSKDEIRLLKNKFVKTNK